MDKYQGKFEKWVYSHYRDQKEFAPHIGASTSAVSKWIMGRAFPEPKFIRAIWTLTKDEIGPMYWYVEWPTDIRLKNESIKMLREKRKRS